MQRVLIFLTFVFLRIFLKTIFYNIHLKKNVLFIIKLTETRHKIARHVLKQFLMMIQIIRWDSKILSYIKPQKQRLQNRID